MMNIVEHLSHVAPKGYDVMRDYEHAETSHRVERCLQKEGMYLI